MRRVIVILLVLAGLAGTVWAITNEYSERLNVLSGQILFKAEELRAATEDPVFDSLEAEGVLTELKDLIKQYEQISGYWIILDSEMHNVQEEHTTLMQLENVVLDSGIDDNNFTERILRRGL